MSKIYFLIAIMLFSFGETFAQNSPKDIALARATADSSYFSVNKRAGWGLFSSYVAPVNTDSVIIEMIVQHDRTIDWKQEQCVGRIKSNSLLPAASQTVSFRLIDNVYQLRVEPNGRCYLRLTYGSLPDADPVIIPVRAVYKR